MVAVAVVAVFTFVARAAVTPTLSLANAGSNLVTVTGFGRPERERDVLFQCGERLRHAIHDARDDKFQRIFFHTINPSSYNIIVGNNVYVIVDGQQSAMQAWPAPTGTPTLSQTSVTLGLGQSTTLYASGSSASVYMATNSSPSVASVQANGTQITITGNQTGGTTATICYTGTASNCASLYITVQTGSVLSFSQNNFTLAVGQGTTVTLTGGSGSYSITSNSNPSDVSAVLGGNTITLTGEAQGSANVAICDTSGNCGTLYVTTGNTSSNGSLYFSNTSPSLTVGGTATVTVSGGSGYYVTGNTSPSVASQVLNGNALTISGLAAGVTTVTVCSASNGCSSFPVTVGGTTSGGTVSFGVSNPALTLGGSMNISLSGAGSYYVSSNANSNIAQASVNGSTITVYGENIGSDSVAVCASGGSCNTLYVTVTQSGTATTAAQSTSASSLLAAIQSMQSELSQLVTQIQTMATTLTQLAANVSAGGTTTSGTAATTATPAGASTYYDFTEFLSAGSQDAQVTELQQYLTQKGFYSGPITGFYGSLTETAVGKYQTAHGIDPAGYVGPSTRAALNAGE